MFITSQFAVLATACLFFFAGESNALPAPISEALSRRAPSGVDISQHQSLWHGTSTTQAASLEKGVKLPHANGDLAPGSTGGGFYLAHDKNHAAQFACHASIEAMKKPPTHVAVFNYEWTPTATTKVLKWENCGKKSVGEGRDKRSYNLQKFMDVNYGKSTAPAEIAWRNALLAGVSMVSAPMTKMAEDQCLAVDFWQYAVVKEADLAHLKQVGKHEEIDCATVPKRTP